MELQWNAAMRGPPAMTICKCACNNNVWVSASSSLSPGISCVCVCVRYTVYVCNNLYITESKCVSVCSLPSVVCHLLRLCVSRWMFASGDVASNKSWNYCSLLFVGSTITRFTYSGSTQTSGACTGEYTIKTYTIGACSSGGVKYQIVPGTASLVPSAAPTAFSSALTLQLSGYFVSAQYSDTRCTTVTSAVSYPLNSCINFSGGVVAYEKYTATAYTIARTEYSDSLCTTAASTLGPTYTDYSASCIDNIYTSSTSSAALINSNGVPPSTLPMMSIRFASLSLIRSYPCSVTPRYTIISTSRLILFGGTKAATAHSM